MRELFNKQQELLYRSYRLSLEKVTCSILQVCSMVTILFSLGFAILRADFLFATGKWVVGFILPSALAGLVYFLIAFLVISIISDRKYRTYKSKLKEISDGVDHLPRGDARSMPMEKMRAIQFNN